VAYCLPGSNCPIFALPLLARLHLPGKGQPSCAVLAKEMLTEVLAWFPKYVFTLVADGAYACKELLGDLDQQRVLFVSRIRSDACVYDPKVPPARPGKKGPKAKKGPKLPKPKEAAAKADRKRSGVGDWLWQGLEVMLYGESCRLQVVSYEVVWPRVLGLRPIQIVVVRDLEGRLKDSYLFTTDVQATASWVVTQFAWRWAIEVLFRSSKQVMDIEAPQHWSRESVEKLAPWVWSMQSVIMVWYLTVGHELPEAVELRERMGDWDSEWSLRHMLRVLRSAILNATINPNSANPAELTEMVQTLKNWANLAA
jgi:DDE superfamily endonuclease